MKRTILILILCILCVNSYAGIFDKEIDYKEALTGYNPIYFICGFVPQEQLKIQLSFKYDLFYPYKIGFYFAYTQLMFWDIFEYSGPFEEIDFGPEAFWRFESGNNMFGDISILFLDYFQIGVEHLSNGKPIEESRGWSRVYGQIQLSAGSLINVGLNYKYFWIFDDDWGSTRYINEYVGSMTTKVFLKLIDSKTGFDLEEIYFQFGFGGGVNGLDFAGGWHELGLKSRTLFSRFRPFIHLYHGYGESIVNYDISKGDLGVPGGIAIKMGLIVE